MLAIIFAITASLLWGTSFVFARWGLQHIKPATATLISLLSSLVLIGSLSLIIELDAVMSLSLAALLWFGLIGALNFGIGRQFSFLGVKYIGVTRSTPITASAPFFAMILAIVFTGEVVNIPIVAGTLCIVGGISLLVTGK